jgi:hypothetical protein
MVKRRAFITLLGGFCFIRKTEAASSALAATPRSHSLAS